MKTEHILVIRFSAMGDVAMTVPVIYSLAKQYPHVRITVLSRPFARPFFENLAHNVGFMEADINGEYKGVKGLNALYRRLIAKQFTAIADLHSVLRSGYLRMRFNLASFKVAHIDKHRKGKRKLVATTDKQLVQQPTSFQNYADVFAQLGYPINMDFTSIFPEEGGDLSSLPQEIFGVGENAISIDNKHITEPWIHSHHTKAKSIHPNSWKKLSNDLSTTIPTVTSSSLEEATTRHRRSTNGQRNTHRW